MAAEVGRRGVPESAGDGDAGIAAILLGQCTQRFQRFPVGVYAHGVVAGLVPCGQSGAAGTGVGDELVGGVSLGEAGVLRVLQPQVARGLPSTRNRRP
jgi:hypothetical protein